MTSNFTQRCLKKKNLAQTVDCRGHFRRSSLQTKQRLSCVTREAPTLCSTELINLTSFLYNDYSPLQVIPRLHDASSEPCRYDGRRVL